MSTWDKSELDEKLANRVEVIAKHFFLISRVIIIVIKNIIVIFEMVQVSKRAVAKIIQAFDRLQQRNEKVSKALKGELGGKHKFKSKVHCRFHCRNHI